jgi:hypothetical protein
MEERRQNYNAEDFEEKERREKKSKIGKIESRELVLFRSGLCDWPQDSPTAQLTKCSPGIRWLKVWNVSAGRHPRLLDACWRTGANRGPRKALINFAQGRNIRARPVQVYQDRISSKKMKHAQKSKSTRWSRLVKQSLLPRHHLFFPRQPRSQP